MSKQWGHGFYKGKIAQVLDSIERTKEYGIDRWISDLRSGCVIFRRDWDSDKKRLFLRNGQLFVCENGKAKHYKISNDDLHIEWSGFYSPDENQEPSKMNLPLQLSP